MPTIPLTPGVTIHELPASNQPIEGVATAVAAFVGLAPAGPSNVPTRITSWAAFERTFGVPNDPRGPFMDNAFLAHAVHGFFGNGGSVCWVVRVGEETFGGRPHATVTSAVEGVDDPVFHVVARTAARPLVTLTVDNEADIKEKKDARDAEDKERKTRLDEAQKGVETAEKAVTDAKDAAATAAAHAALADTQTKLKEIQDERPKAPSPPPKLFTLKVGDTETFSGLTATPGPSYILTKVNAESKLIELQESGTLLPAEQRVPKAGDVAMTATDPYAIAAPTSTALMGMESKMTGIRGLAAADDMTMLCVPDMMAIAGDPDGIRGVQQAISEFCQAHQCMAILDPPPGFTPTEINNWAQDDATPANEYMTMYWPWLRVIHPINGRKIEIPPSGHMAGIWSRTDATRGVHKAPGNEEVTGAIEVAFELNDADQGQLNQNGINCIRGFRGRGIRTWGARTLAVKTAPAWKYVNVRRLFNYVEASILNGTQWAVFEPNDEVLWAQLRVSVGNFLTTVWRSGALFGSTPDEAFFVRCDRQTNPQDMIDAGVVTVMVGIAPVKPAEFVVFQISQYDPAAAA